MLSDIVKNEVVKKTKLGHKLNPFQTTDTSYLLKKDNYDTKIDELKTRFLTMVNTLPNKNLIV